MSIEDRLRHGFRQALEKYAPASFDPLIDDMTVQFAIQLAEKDNELGRLRTERDTWLNIAESHEPATRLRQAEFVRMDSELGRVHAYVDRLRAALVGVIRVADRSTLEFDEARAALAAGDSK